MSLDQVSSYATRPSRQRCNHTLFRPCPGLAAAEEAQHATLNAQRARVLKRDRGLIRPPTLRVVDGALEPVRARRLHAAQDLCSKAAAVLGPAHGSAHSTFTRLKGNPCRAVLNKPFPHDR